MLIQSIDIYWAPDTVLSIENMDTNNASIVPALWSLLLNKKARQCVLKTSTHNTADYNKSYKGNDQTFVRKNNGMYILYRSEVSFLRSEISVEI